MRALKELLSNSSTDISFSETVIDSENNIDEIDEITFVSWHIYVELCYYYGSVPSRILSREYLLLPWIPNMQEKLFA